MFSAIPNKQKMQSYKINTVKKEKMIEEMEMNMDQPEVELRDQGDRETVVEEEQLVAS